MAQDKRRGFELVDDFPFMRALEAFRTFFSSRYYTFIGAVLY
jgi:hypothetical protein